MGREVEGAVGGRKKAMMGMSSKSSLAFYRVCSALS